MLAEVLVAYFCNVSFPVSDVSHVVSGRGSGGGHTSRTLRALAPVMALEFSACLGRPLCSLRRSLGTIRPAPPPHFSGYYDYGSQSVHYGGMPFDQYGTRYQSSGTNSGLQYPKLPQAPPPPTPPMGQAPHDDPLPHVKVCTLRCCTRQC